MNEDSNLLVVNAVMHFQHVQHCQYHVRAALASNSVESCIYLFSIYPAYRYTRRLG